MIKVGAVKSALCLGVAALLVVGANEAKTYATGICAETSLAGISLSLEQYIETKAIAETALTDINKMSRIMEEPKEEPKEEIVKEAEEAPVVEKVSKYENMGISVANDYVNIRKKPDTESEILGKLYRGSAATILKRDGDWVKIESGSVKGYIKSEFLAIGFDAEELEDMFGTKWATVNTTTLKVREKKNTDSIVLGLIPMGETYEVIKEYDDWVKILVDEGGDGDESTKGYVSGDFVDITVEFEHAISVEEEQAELRRAEEARKAEEERLKKLEEENRRKEQQSSNNTSSNNTSSNNTSSNNTSSNNTSSNNTSSSNTSSNNGSSQEAQDQEVTSGSGSEIASYAQKFVGNPYVYGGTSLTNGADCSGFTQAIFSHFGVSIPRTSRTQAGAGKKVSFDSLSAGDLILYASNGTVNHVALYIGGGQVVHASNHRTGIKISTWNYRTPYTARRVVE
ncbi:MAG: C40 family peptidase [Acetivibrio sp.]